MRQSQRVMRLALPGTATCFQPVPSHTGHADKGSDEYEVAMRSIYENTTIWITNGSSCDFLILFCTGFTQQVHLG
jgi:hypothetical protein